MDQVFFHPKVVHLPMALAVLMPLVAGGVAFAWWRGWFDRRVWTIVVLLQCALAGSGLIAMNTGETEEERIEEFVAERYIEAHEEAAEVFVWASAIVLGLMILPVVLSHGRLRNTTMAVACIGTLVVLGLGYRTGEAGGRLVYQHGAARAYVTGVPASSDESVRSGAHDEDEDD